MSKSRTSCTRFSGISESVDLPSRFRHFCIAAYILAAVLAPTAIVGQAAAGYAVTDFATGFPNGGAIGPIGLAFDASRNLFVMDLANGILYKFGPAGGTVSAASQVNTAPITNVPSGLTFTKDGGFYLARQGGDVVQLDPSTGAVIRSVASVPGATGIATDPLTGDLFVSGADIGSPNIMRISNFKNGPGTVTTYATVPPTVDGLTFIPDGTLFATIYGSGGGVAKISATNSPTPGVVSVLSGVTVPSIDGLAISADPNTPFIYGNRNDGTITKIDLITTPATLTNIFTGGSRGDFVTVGPDGCLYATQTDRILKVTNADGTCGAPPLGPLFPTNPAPRPVSYKFSAFCTELAVDREEPGSIRMHSIFRLAANSDGINPLLDPVTLQLGGFSTVIPAGSFIKSEGGYRFEGLIDGVELRLRLQSSRGSSFTLLSEARGLDPRALEFPVSVNLTIRNDTGSTSAFHGHRDDDKKRQEPVD
jgi:hypothetical protein